MYIYIIKLSFQNFINLLKYYIIYLNIICICKRCLHYFHYATLSWKLLQLINWHAQSIIYDYDPNNVYEICKKFIYNIKVIWFDIYVLKLG